MARQVLDEPRLILVANENAGTTGCTGVFIDGCQQGDAFAGRACLAEQDRGDFGLLDAVVHIGVNRKGSVLAVQRLGGRDHDALLVGASLLIRRVVVGAVAVRADARGIVVTARGVAVAVVGEGVGEAVAAIVDLACLVIPGCADIEQLVVVVGSQILDAAEHRRAVLREVAADVERRAGKSRRHYGQRHGSRHDRRSDFLKRHHVPIPLSFIVGV